MATEKVNLGKKGSFTVHKGALHRALGVPAGEKIPQRMLTKALHGKSGRLKRMAASAKGLEAMKH